MNKVTFTPDGEAPVEFYVVEQTKIGGVDYLLVTETEEGDSDALILKDVTNKDAEEKVYAVVSEDKELAAVAEVFETLLDDIEFI